MSQPPADDEGWSGDARALLHAYRSDHDPSLFDRARLDRALAERVARAGSSAASHAPTPSRGVRVASTASAKRWLAGACLALGAAGAFWANARHGDASKSMPLSAAQTEHTSISDAVAVPAAAPAAQAEPTPRTTAASVSPARTSPHAHTNDLAPATSATHRLRTSRNSQPVATAPRAAERAADDGSAAAQSESVLSNTQPPTAASNHDSADPGAELAIMARINAAVRGAKLHQALAFCAEHEQRWPHGTFQQERDGVRALVACKLQLPEAQSRTRAFLASYPHGALAPSVRAACTPIDAAPQRPSGER